MTKPSSGAAEDALRSEAETHRKAILAGDRRAMARTITLLESTRAEQAELGQAVLESLVPESGQAIRVGITGPPGVGKSTFIEALGVFLVESGHRVAVLAVDPTSPITGGSILGDKTRMERLAVDERAFIRPSPSGGALGGVAHRTREAMLLCEAAGYDVVLVETVGIGQSEVSVASMVDFFLVLLQPGAGDDLQGLKKGVLELADAMVVNKADGDSIGAAKRTQAAHANALSLLRPRSQHWSPQVLSVSSLTGDGIAAVWETVEVQRDVLEASGDRQARRREQTLAWMWTLVDEGLAAAFRENPGVSERLPALEAEVQALERTPSAAARLLLATFANKE
jgi:LAO/AO transport system kinase